MKFKIIDKKEIPALIDKLIERYRVFAPVDAGKYARLMEVASGSEASLELQNPKLASKEILLPQTEIILSSRTPSWPRRRSSSLRPRSSSESRREKKG